MNNSVKKIIKSYKGNKYYNTCMSGKVPENITTPEINLYFSIIQIQNSSTGNFRVCQNFLKFT